VADRTAIVYFSQTGNTEKVARAIARGMEACGTAPDLLRLETTDPRTLADYDFIGLGVPSFYFKLPFNVKWFMKAMRPMKGKFAFAFLTQGGHPGLALREMKRRLARRGVTMVDAFGCLGVDTYPPYIGMNWRAGHPDDAELAAAEAFGRGLIARRDRIKGGAKELVPSFPRQFDRFAALGLVLTRPIVALISPIKRVNAAKCTRCGLCVKRCPTANISLGGTRDKRLAPALKFGWRCAYCYWCERVCPVQAIECDWRRMKRRLNRVMNERPPAAS
jgi:flavodoxin/ferredoxin